MGYNYVILGLGDREIPIIYPDVLVHKQIAEAIQPLVEQMRGEEDVTPVKVVSAGSLQLTVNTCEGRSTTLNLESRGDTDEQQINCMPYWHGMLEPKPLSRDLYMLVAHQNNAEFGVIATLLKHNKRHWATCPECGGLDFDHHDECELGEIIND